MTKSGFDIDEIERLLGNIGDTIDEWDEDEPRDDWYGWQRSILKLSNSAPAMIAELRELRAENARLREITATNKQAWDNALELGLIPERHRNTVQIMSDGCRAALGEPQ